MPADDKRILTYARWFIAMRWLSAMRPPKLVIASLAVYALSFVLIGFFLWVAENVATLVGAWSASSMWAAPCQPGSAWC